VISLADPDFPFVVQGTLVQGAVSLGFVSSAKDWIMYQRIAQNGRSR